jgi:hypothetical protein
MEKEEIFDLLGTEGLEPKYINFTDTGYSREIEFKACEQTYFITWYKNMSTLSVSNQGLNKFHFTSIVAKSAQVYCSRALLFKYGNDNNDFSVCIKEHSQDN